MDAKQLAQTDNAADKTITLAISGNRLVMVLNALDAAMYGLKRYELKGNDVVACNDWYAELRETTEAMRDELSAQRCGTRSTLTCDHCGAARQLVCINCH